MTRRMGPTICLFFVALHLQAQDGGSAAVKQKDNGIAVGKPKIFDNRSLTIMLNQLSATLANTTFFDPNALAAALQFFQGAQSQSTSTTLSGGYTSASALAAMAAGNAGSTGTSALGTAG